MEAFFAAVAATVSKFVASFFATTSHAAATSAGPATMATAGKIAYAATYATLMIGSYAITSSQMGDLPKGAAGKQPIQNAVSPRMRVINRARMPGAVMLRENRRNRYLIMVTCQAPVLSIARRWLHSDVVTLDGSGKVIAPAGSPAARYRAHGVWWLDRSGSAGQTSFNDGVTRNGETLTDLGAGVWGASHLLLGVQSLCLIASPVERPDFQAVYPYGKPVPTQAPIGAVYDWRLDGTRGGTGSHRLNDMSTWGESWNPVVWLATRESGPVEADDFVARFVARVLSQVDAWTQAADDCDGNVTLAAGGTEDRYRTAGGWHFDTNDPADFRGRLLASFDGFTLEVGNGGLHVQAGVYRAPTFTLPIEHIIEDSWWTGRRLDRAYNEYAVSYFSLDHDWEVVPGTPWRDEADITATGPQSIAFAAEWVPSHGQARRLAKIDMSRKGARQGATIKASLYALVFIYGPPPVEGDVPNRRWLNIEREAADGTIETVVCELASSPKIDMAAQSVTFDVILATPAAYDWTAATEEGTPPEPPVEAETALVVMERRFDLISQSTFNDLATIV